MTRSRHGPRRREAAQGAMLNREKGLIPQFSRSILRPSQQLRHLGDGLDIRMETVGGSVFNIE